MGWESWQKSEKWEGVGMNLEGFWMWIKGSVRGLVTADGKKEKNFGADIQLQSMGYAKQQDADVSDSSVCASDAPENPRLLRIV